MCGRKAEGIGVNLKHCQYSKSQSVQKSEKWEQVLLEKQSYIWNICDVLQQLD